MPVALAATLAIWNWQGRLYVSRSAQRIADMDVRCGVLYENYKHRAFLWEAFILARRLVTLIIVVFVPINSGRSSLMTLLCYAVLGVSKYLNLNEFLFLLLFLFSFCIFLFCFVLFFFFFESAPHHLPSFNP